MSDVLKVIEFDESLLSLVADFDCSSGLVPEVWEAEINDWIRLDPAAEDGAAYWSARGTQVWLFVDAADDIVGYASLCRSNWPDPTVSPWTRRLPRKPISLIPAVGIDRRFHGCPKGASRPDRYSSRILTHLVRTAAAHADRLPVLGLYVHPDNSKAIAFYSNAGFVPLVGQVSRNTEFGVDYPAMIKAVP